MQNMLRFQQANVGVLNGDLRQKALQNNNRNTFGHPYVLHIPLCAVADAFLRPRGYHGAVANTNHDPDLNSSSWRRSWRLIARNNSY